MSRLFDRKKVLIIDDDVPTLRFLRRVCEAHGYQVSTGTNPEDLRWLFFNERPGKLFIDLDLGDANGLDAYEFEVVPEMLGRNWLYDGNATLLTGVLPSRDVIVRAHRLGMRFSNKSRSLLAKIRSEETIERMHANVFRNAMESAGKLPR